MSSYLPKNSVTKQSLSLLEKEFGITSNMEVMIEEDNVIKGEYLSKQLKEIDHVKQVMWLGSVVDITKPIDTYPSDMVEAFYKDGKLLFLIEFLEDEYSMNTDKAIHDVKMVLITMMRNIVVSQLWRKAIVI